MLKRVYKSFLKSLVLLLISILIGALALFAVYSLPTERIKANIKTSENLYQNNFIHNWDGNYRYGEIDHYTDYLIVDEAVCRKYENVFYNALLNPHHSYTLTSDRENDGEYYFSLMTEDQKRADDYPRYWHGYLTYIIPGLFFYNVGGLKMMMTIVWFLFSMVFLCKLNTIDFRYALSFAFTILFISPITVSLNFQNADVLILSILFSIVILYGNEWLNRTSSYYLLFMLIGILTNYFDFLTYPLLTWAFALSVFFIMNPYDLKESVKKMIIYSASWVVGYGGMWAGKWVLASLITDYDVFGNVQEAILCRALGMGEDLSVSRIIEVTLDSINNPPIVSLFLLSFLSIIVISVLSSKKKPITKEPKYCLGIFIIIALAPVAWALVLRNHYVTHQMLEYRTLAVSFLAAQLIIIKACSYFRKKHY